MKSELQLALENRFGEHRVQNVPVAEGDLPLLLLDLEVNSPITVIMTNGLSDYKMPTSEKVEGREFNEIYFCLPSYWEWEDLKNPRMNWIFPWIQRLGKYVKEKNTWFGHGHTLPCGADMQSLSDTMNQNHFMLSDPMLLENELTPVIIGNKTIHFLSIIPIYPDEMDYKQGKGTFKFVQKLRQHGITEKLDDFRGTVLKSKWRMIRK